MIMLNIRSLSPPNKSRGVLITFFTDTSVPVLLVKLFADTDSDTDTTHCTTESLIFKSKQIIALQTYFSLRNNCTCDVITKHSCAPIY